MYTITYYSHQLVLLPIDLTFILNNNIYWFLGRLQPVAEIMWRLYDLIRKLYCFFSLFLLLFTCDVLCSEVRLYLQNIFKYPHWYILPNAENIRREYFPPSPLRLSSFVPHKACYSLSVIKPVTHCRMFLLGRIFISFVIFAVVLHFVFVSTLSVVV